MFWYKNLRSFSDCGGFLLIQLVIMCIVLCVYSVIVYMVCMLQTTVLRKENLSLNQHHNLLITIMFWFFWNFKRILNNSHNSDL